MATLIVTGATIYRGQTLTDITQIEFQTNGQATAYFDATQFGPGLISDNVAITGDINQNDISVFLSSGKTSFSAVGWTFSNWDSTLDGISLIGSNSADTIIGSEQFDDIQGGGGGDSLFGGAGDDRLNGGAGADTLSGGIGNDTYSLDDVHLASGGGFIYDQVIEPSNGGVDHVYVGKIGTSLFTPSSYTLPDEVENGTIQGSGGFSLFGNGLDNSLGVDVNSGGTTGHLLSGEGGNDTLTGGRGDDILEGGDGNDSLFGGNGSDTASYASAGSAVTVNLGIVFGAQNTGGAGTDELSGLENLTGSAFNDTLIGDGNANVLAGGAGDDLLDAKGGADTLRGRDGNDTLNGGVGLDKLIGGRGLDNLNGGAGNDSFIYTALNESGTTAATRDRITGFTSGDKIDVHLIDAIAGGADDAFVLDTDNSFSQGEIRQSVTTNGHLLIEFNADADAAPDMSILLLHHSTVLTTGDFVL